MSTVNLESAVRKEPSDVPSDGIHDVAGPTIGLHIVVVLTKGDKIIDTRRPAVGILHPMIKLAVMRRHRTPRPTARGIATVDPCPDLLGVKTDDAVLSGEWYRWTDAPSACSRSFCHAKTTAMHSMRTGCSVQRYHSPDKTASSVFTPSKRILPSISFFLQYIFDTMQCISHTSR